MSLKVVACLVTLAVVGTFAQGPDSTVVEPCHGISQGWARDLNSCSSFWRCAANPISRGECRQGTFFSVERQECVNNRNDANCFVCNTNVWFQWQPVFNSCRQFTQCFGGRHSLHACPAPLVYDSRPHVNNCGRSPPGGGCWPVAAQIAPIQCPNVQPTRPLIIRVPNSCQAYHRCTRPGLSETWQCEGDLRINTQTGQCDLPQNVQCDARPSPPPNNQRGPAVACPNNGQTTRVPDRVSCNEFWLCSRTNAAPQWASCANGLIFDDITRDCANPQPGRTRCWFTHNGIRANAENNEDPPQEGQ